MSSIVDLTDKEGNYKLWRVFVNFAAQKPLGFLAFMAIQFVFVLIAYTDEVGFGRALGIAFLIDLFWLIIFIALPALFQFLMGLVVLLMAIGISVLLIRNLDVENIFEALLIFAVVFVALLIIFALLSIVIYCLPGILVASAVYAGTESTLFAVISFIVVTIIFIFVVFLVSKYILPFIFGYGLNWIAVVLANQLAVAIVLGLSVASLFQGGYSFDYYGAFERSSSLLSMIESMTYLPTAMTIWTFFSGIFCGLLNTPLRTRFMKTGETLPEKTQAGSRVNGMPPLPVAGEMRAAPAAGIPPLPQSAASSATPPPLSVYCWNCGNELEADASFCTKCGSTRIKL